MCGICGVHRFRPGEISRNHLESMLQTIEHRGTISSTSIYPRAAFGVRRLPIIDVAHSPQPIANEDGRFILVGNGEIFNYRELRERLRAQGHSFRTEGDLECVLHLYEEYGNDCWRLLRGQFAIAIYEPAPHRLTIARDQMGIKPLFYLRSADEFLFGSEIKAIAAHPSFRARLNPQAIADYLSLQYVPKPQTIYRDVHSLPQGSLLILENDKLSIERYSRITLAERPIKLARAEAAAETTTLLKQAIRRQLIADVPVGVLLSGGLDSSSIAVLAKEVSDHPLQTFSIVFKEPTFDESKQSRLMARHLGSIHHEVVLDEESILASMEDVARHLEEPFCEGSAFPIYHICKHAREHVTVLLAGEGADEVFCGYETYMAQQFLRSYNRLPSRIRRIARNIVHRLPVSDNKVSLDLKLRRFVDGAEFEPPKAHFLWRAAISDTQKAGILNSDFAKTVDRPESSLLYEEAFAGFSSEDVINKIMAVDCGMHLVDDLLLRGDRMSMAHTMELRVPFLDEDLVHFAFSLSSENKMRGFTNKILLRDAMAGSLPEEIRTRQKKGLNVPYQKWFKRPMWKQFLHDHLNRSQLDSSGIFNVDGVLGLLDRHENEVENNAHALWAILNLTLWMRSNGHRFSSQ